MFRINLSNCNQTYIRYKNINIENEYLYLNHKYINRFINSLNCTANKLRTSEDSY